MRYLAFGTTAATIVAGVALGMTASNADQHTPPATAVSAAHGHGLFADVVGLDLLGTGSAKSAFGGGSGWTESDISQVAVNLLGLDVNVGTVTLPLLKDPGDPGAGGLLELGSLSALVGTADSPSETQSVATSGILGSGGNAVVLNPNDVDPQFAPATLDVSALIEQVIGAQLRDTLLDTASFEIGALGAKAEKNNGTLTREYMLADLNAEVHSNLLGGLVQTVHGTVDDLVDPIDQLVGPSGAVRTALQGIVTNVDALPLVDASIGDASIDLTGLVTTVNDELLATPLQNVDQSITIDLNSGLVTIDLAKIIVENHPTATSLNDLGANTNALSGSVVNAILAGVSDALIGSGTNSLVSKVVTAVTDGIYSAQVNLSLNVGLGLDTGLPAVGTISVAQGPIAITSTIGSLIGEAGYDPTHIDVTGVALLPGLPCVGIPPLAVCVSDLVDIGALLQPVINLLTPAVATLGQTVLAPVVDTVLPGLQQGLLDVVQPLVTSLLDDALRPVLEEVVRLTINEQPATGDLNTGSATVRALSLTLLPSLAPVSLSLASASVLAADPPAALTATPAEVARGEIVALAGTNFTPNSQVTFTVDGAAAPALTATTNGAGAVATSWTVPGAQAFGTVTFVGTDAQNKSATATTEVVEPTLNAPDAVQGSTLQLTGTNFVPGETVTITLPDGTTTTVTADATDGSIVYDWAVPHTWDPANSAQFTATGASGRTATDSAAITRAVATLTASPNPVAAGGTVTLTGANFAPNEPITLTLPADCVAVAPGAVTASAAGGFTVTCVVGAAVADGTTLNFSASGDDSGRSATAQAEVDSNPSADVNTNASASAAASAQADGNNNAVAVAAAQAAAMANNTTAASADADASANTASEAAARASVSAGASTTASASATSAANASAQSSAQASADSTAGVNANASASGSVAGSVDARAASQAASDAAANGTDASADASAAATANAQTNANASASASASAMANGNQEAAAVAAAQAAAYSAANSDASAAGTVDATAAAEAAAYSSVEADASTTASSDATTTANSSAQAAARSTATTAATATASSTAIGSQNADSDAAGDNSADFDSASAAEAAAMNSATADATGGPGASGQASQDAAANVRANANASASASASADADNHSNPSAQAAAQAAAFASSESDASAAATVDATAAAQAAARASVQATASADASEDAGSSALAAATSTATAAAAQDANSTAAADVNAEASSAAAAQATASVDASSTAAADVNASASAAASAQADSNANAAAQAAAETSAMANASTTATASASAAATANAVAAAQAAAETAARANVRATASANASQDTSAQANVAASASAQASADHSATVNADASSAANSAATANASSAAEAAARQAANVDSTANASASAAATATATSTATAAASAQASSQGSADASGGKKLVNTGATIGGLSVLGLLLLVAGSLVLLGGRRRKSLIG